MSRYGLSKFDIPESFTPGTAFEYFKEYYGIDISRFSPDTQQILSLFAQYGASEAIMMFLQEAQSTEIEETATEM